MITCEVKAANKNFRIYRPDVSLPVICATNGPSIVRKMIPCFADYFPEDVYEDKIETDKSGQTRKVRVPKKFDNPRFSFLYGLNVRTPQKSDVLPFFTVYRFKKWKSGKGIGSFCDDFKVTGIELKIPDFTDKYKIRELFLYAPLGPKGEINKKEEIQILSLTTEQELDSAHLIKDLMRPDGFFLKQTKALGLKEGAYLWLTSEDYNVNTAGDALSNIIAISDDYDAIAKFIMPRRLDFINLLFLIKARYLFDAEIAQRDTAIASAKAAIMSRNMSHNLGSHVMAYLKQHLSSVQDMVKDNVLASLFSPEVILTIDGLNAWYKKFEQSSKDQQEIALPFLVGLGKFISYLQERQDFIATIATDYVPYFSSVNFKDFIYDELNPDLRYQRHKDRIGLQPDNILLGNIARSEGLARKTNPTKGKDMADIVIKYQCFDGQPVFEKDGKTPIATVEDVDKKIKALDNMRKFMIQLPGGVVGRQAIFSIVENVIRNAAKHGKFNEATDKKLCLTFDRYYLDDYQNGRIKNDFVPKGEERFYDFFKRYYAGASDIDNLCVVTLTDNTSFEKAGAKKEECKRLDAIRGALIEAYIDKTSVQMLQTNKGIKEMRISAAWMRGIEDDVKINPLYITEDFDNSKDPEDHWIHVNPDEEDRKQEKNGVPFVYKYWKNHQWVGKAPVLMVRACANNENEDYHLQYVFCLPKPHDLAIVLSDKEYQTLSDSKTLDGIKGWFSRNAWDIFSEEGYIEAKNKSYEFIILSSQIDDDRCNEMKRLSPLRVFKEEQVKDIIKFDNGLLSTHFKDFKKTLLQLYKNLCHFDPQNDIIIISDEKAGKNIGEEKPANVLIRDGETSGKYLYRTHNETENLFSDYITKADPATVFVEGITGNNSTDRLVRNDKIDDFWLYKHLHAMKTSVGIFDERIFAKIYKKDESDIRLAEEYAQLEKEIPSLEERKQYLKDKAKDDSDLRRIIRSIRNEQDYKRFTTVLGDYMSIAYERKGVSIFNLIKRQNGLDIYGYGDIINENGKLFGSIVKVGGIYMKNGRITISNPNHLKFDYLSIHQGLLDKVYEQFDIRHNAKKKHNFTKDFYKAFCTSQDIITYRDEAIVGKNGNPAEVYFLPQLRIHSGRSKPSFADMPQQQPFIQYAAIENAVMDCKYSLIELLDFARYE